MSSFVHLHVHSEYSLLDGAARMNSLVQRAKDLGMNALALTDHGVMYGAIPFYEACLNAGIKPIIGCEVYVAGNSMLEKGTRTENPIYHLVLLAKDNQGYQNLMRLCSIAQLEGFHYRPRIDFERLQQHAEGLICLSSCLAGEVPQAILNGEMDKAREVAKRYQALFGPDYFLEIQDHQLLEQKKVLGGLMQLSEQLSIPLVATNDVHYVNAEEAELQDVLICIGTGKTLHDEERLRFSSNQLYLKSEDEMKQLFPHLQDAITQTAIIANRCELKIDLYEPILPQFKPLPAGQSTLDYLKEKCELGLRNRYVDDWRWVDAEAKKELYERLYYEISVIGRMGYADYFLIVADFIRFAHEQSIPVGPGRGSAAGSLVAYVLRITDVDPIKYGLLFERFLNPERVSMPDIDIDFSDERRDEVIDYVVNKYGSEHVAQIITFGTMAARAAVRDVGRVLELPYETVDRVAKLIPQQVGMTIEQAVRQTPELARIVKEDAQIVNLLKVARDVEGFPRHVSTHAAGLVISEAPLTDHVPLQQGNEQISLTQYAMGDLEKIGLMKMDFLGLRTLSIIERTLGWIKVFDGSAIDISTVPFGFK